MLRSLSRRGSSLFEYKIVTEAADLRATELFLQSCSYSDFASIAPSFQWQNRLNSLRQAFFRFFRLPRSLLLRLLIAFIIFWLGASAIIRPIERSNQLARQDEEDSNVYALRLQFLQKFGRMDYYIPMTNPEWEESTRYLISRHEEKLINLTSTNWTIPYAFAFAFFAGSGSTVPGTTQLRLSEYSKIFLVLWFPTAIALHFLSVLTLIFCIRRIPTNWRYMLLLGMAAGWMVYRGSQSMRSLAAEMFHHFFRTTISLLILLELLDCRGRIHRKILVRWSIEHLRRSYSADDRSRLITDYGRISPWKRWETKFLFDSDYRKIDYVLREIQNG